MKLIELIKKYANQFHGENNFGYFWSEDEDCETGMYVQNGVLYPVSGNLMICEMFDDFTLSAGYISDIKEHIEKIKQLQLIEKLNYDLKEKTTITKKVKL